jgi:AcrR family transcriptional regulator
MLSTSKSAVVSSSRERSSVDIGDRILDAAASCVTAYGVERVTLAEIARRAGVSRPTVYRRWTDTREILAAVLTSRVIGVWRDVPSQGRGREALVKRIVAVADRLRRDELIMSVLLSSPELAMVYITQRLGTSQQVLIDAAAAEIEAAQRDGSVRAGDPRQLAAMVLLITQSTIQSAQIVRPILDADVLARELAHSLNGYLS